MRRGALDRTHKGFFAFREIGVDQAQAKHRREAPFDGEYRLVRDDTDGPHAARWRADRNKLGGGEWVYSNGQPVARTIVAWSARSSDLRNADPGALEQPQAGAPA